MPTEINNLTGWPIKRVAYKITAADIVALGASATGTITLAFNLPPKGLIMACGIKNGGTAAATLSTLTATLGYSGNASAFIGDQTVFAANAGIHRIPEYQQHASLTADTPLTMLFTGSGNLSGLTGLNDGVIVTIAYLEG